MTEARRERVPADLSLARAHLHRAREFLEDAARVESLATQQVLAYQACVAALEATVQGGGFRIAPGSGYHHQLLRTAQELLEPERADLIETIDEARELRAGVSYYAGFVSEEAVASLRDAARDLMREVDRYLASLD